MDFSLSELNDVLGDIKNLGKEKINFFKFKNISIDSRTLLKNDLFIACLLYTSELPTNRCV